jgi:DNA processing protein
VTDNATWWVWLQCALGVSSALRTQEIADAFAGGARAIYESSDYERRIAGVFTAVQLERMRRTPKDAATPILEECTATDVHILTPQDSAYPLHLRQIPNLPLALYVKGDLACLQGRLGLAIVGTRRADRKSVDIAGRLSADLTRAGCTVISGGALGIDSAAHWGALHAGGPTVCVLGCGLRSDYLSENAALRARVAQTGAVVSEYPGGAAPLARNFPTRNRIISGLAVGTIVVEASEKSGSLITATCAAEQGRDVFAVPGDAFGSTYTGGNKLIREGAKPVFAAMDVLEEYELLYPDLLNMRRAERNLARPAMDPGAVTVKAQRPAAPPAPAPQKPPSSAKAAGRNPRKNPLEESVLQLLSGDALHIDELMKRTDATPGQLFAALTALEIEGLVQQQPGKLFAGSLRGNT